MSNIISGVSRCSYRAWNDTNLMNAMQAVERGVPLRRAAELYNIPKSTLHDHVSGKVEFQARSGPDPYLSVEEEEELCNFLAQVASIGYPRTKKQVLGLVRGVLASKGIEASVTNGWWERFCQRNPKMSLRSGVPLSLARASATDPEMLNRYYDTLEHSLRENDLFNKPGIIFNCDETGLALNPAAPRVIQEIGSKNPNFITGGNHTQLTVLVCTSASGYVIPPYIIFDRLTWNAKLADGEIPGSLYGLSKNGWIDSELFNSWFINHFLNYVPQCRPLLLLLDGHSAHYCPAFIKCAAEEGIVVFVLPPNTTHLTQPLDRGCFSPLKMRWREVCQDFRTCNPGRVVTRFDFSRLFSKAWYQAMTAENIIGSFKVTGVCPFSRCALPEIEEEAYTKFQPDKLVRKTGLKFIPMYCPSPCRISSTPRSTKANESSNAHHLKSNENPANTLSPPTLNERFSREASVPLRSSTNLSGFLIPPVPPNKIPSDRVKSCGRCLTSAEGLRMIEDKEKKKQEKIKKKEERKQQQERKKEQKAKVASKKAQAKGRKARKNGNYCIFLFSVFSFPSPAWSSSGESSDETESLHLGILHSDSDSQSDDGK